MVPAMAAMPAQAMPIFLSIPCKITVTRGMYKLPMTQDQPILSHRPMLKSILIGFLIGFLAMATGQDGMPSVTEAEAFLSD